MPATVNSDEGEAAALQRSMERTNDALRKRWQSGQIAMSTTYAIDVPAQSLLILGEQQAQHALKTLKGLGVKGTYRVTKGGRNARDRGQTARVEDAKERSHERHG